MSNAWIVAAVAATLATPNPSLAQAAKKSGGPSSTDIAKCNTAANVIWHAITSAVGKPVWVERDEGWMNKYYDCMESFGYEISRWNGTIGGAPAMQPPNARMFRAYYLRNGHMALPPLFGGRAFADPIPGLDTALTKSTPDAPSAPVVAPATRSADTVGPSSLSRAKGAPKANKDSCAAFKLCASDTPRAANMSITTSPSIFAKCGAPPAGC